MGEARDDGEGARVRSYEVRFTYVEPLYARARGIEVVPYGARFVVRARTPEQAIRAARAEFAALAARSSVSWPREIRDTTCRPVEDAAALAG